MKIMYLLFSFTTGGTERLVADICNEMADRGHEVHLYVVNDLYTHSMLDTLGEKVRIELQKRPVGGGDKLNTLMRIARYIRKHKIEVIHCNSLDAPELLVLKPVAFPGTRVVYTVHNMTGYRTLSGVKVRYRNMLCHRLIAISESVRQEMLACGADSRKTVTVYNAIDLARFSRGGTKEFDAERPVIGNVARIDSAVKGQDVLIRATAALRDRYPGLRCLLAGAADEAHREDERALRKLAEDLDMEENVIFLGNVGNIPEFLEKIDIFVLPSRSEGFGISLVEAMAMGVPCVASSLDGPAEVLCNGKYGQMFRVGDPEDLAEQLANMIENLDFYKKEAERAVKAVRELYDIRRMCDSLLSAYL